MAYREADSCIGDPGIVWIVNPGVEGKARAELKADHRADIVGIGGPADSDTGSHGVKADRSVGAPCPGAHHIVFNKRPVSLASLEDIDPLMGNINPDQVLRLAGVAFGVDPDFPGQVVVIIFQRPF